MHAGVYSGLFRMNYRNLITQTFGPAAYGDALFYSVPGGLRFSLSENGEALDQVLTALRKATAVLEFAFSGNEKILICLRRWMGASPFSLRHSLRELAAAGIRIPVEREYWLEVVPTAERWEEDVEEWSAIVAFEIPVSSLQSLLWCAFTTDFRPLKPNPGCSIYLIDLAQGFLVHPYDDRGMDVVGPNHELLSGLYRRFTSMLLDHDRSTMDATFSKV